MSFQYKFILTFLVSPFVSYCSLKNNNKRNHSHKNHKINRQTQEEENTVQLLSTKRLNNKYIYITIKYKIKYITFYK
jgi:hypothetical protein